MRETPNSNSLVSIGFMTCNRGSRLLREALDSLLAQTYENFELIVSDDASEDDTQKICGDYAARDSRIKYIRQKSRLGIPGCFNFVRSQATGKYFMWAADDDFWKPAFLEKCVAVLENNPDLIMAISDFAETDEYKKIIYKAQPKKFFPFSKNIYERLKSFILFYKDNGPHLVIYGLWNREKISNIPLLVKKGGGYWWGYSDHFVFCSLAQGPFGFVDELLWLRMTKSRIFQTKRQRLLARIAFSLKERIDKIIGTPYFWYNMGCVWRTKGLSFFDKLRLSLWNFYVMARLFFVRKI